MISIKDSTIEEVLGAHEEKRLYEVVNESKSIFDVEAIFNKRIKEGKTAYVLLISKNEHIKSPTNIVGIMTPWDIPEIVKNK